MNATNLLALALAFVILSACLAAFFISLGLLFPGRVARTQQMMTVSPGRSVLVGLVNVLFLSVIVLILSQLAQQSGGGLWTLLVIVIAAFLVIGICFGLAGAVHLVGMRILPERGSLERTFASSILLSLGCAFPLAGWFGLLPYLVCYGLGGFILTLFDRKAAPAAP